VIITMTVQTQWLCARIFHERIS